MLNFTSKILLRNASIIDSNISLNDIEKNIFEFLQSFLKSQPKPITLRVAGGWVRDKLLGKQSKDLDITVEGMSGVEFANQLKHYAVTTYGPKQNKITSVKDTEARPDQIKNLSVAFTVILGQEVEFLSLRGNEIYEPGNRNPVSVNKNASPKSDAVRRDLTINALFYNINTNQIEDYTEQGFDDLATMTLRTPLDPIVTFRDDPLRLLRIIRFYSKYTNSKIDPKVLQAMQDEEVQSYIVGKILNPNELTGITPERIAIEFRKIMSGSRPDKAVKVLYETGLLSKMLNLPSNFHPLNMDQRNKHHKLNVIEHSIQVLKNVNNLSFEFGLDDEYRMKMNIASLFHDLGKLDPRSHNIKNDGNVGYSGNPNDPNSISHQESSSQVWSTFASALKLSDDETEFIKDLVSNHMNPHAHIEQQKEIHDKHLRRYLRKNPSWFFQYIHAAADAMSKSDEENSAFSDPYRQNIERLKILQKNPNSGNIIPNKDILNGQEIMNIVGLPAKPPAGVNIGYIELIKEKIRELQDENPTLTKEEAKLFVLQIMNSGILDAYKIV